MRILPAAVYEAARRLYADGFLHLWAPQEDRLLIGITHVDGKVEAEVATATARVRFELEPAEALRLAFAFKQHADLAQRQRAAAADAVPR